VFLDLKFHDIPNTVAGAMRNVAKMGVRLATVHASGGLKMMQAAVEAAGADCGVLAVTVLTSLDDAQLGEAWGRDRVDVENEVLRLAELARSAGCHGIVCSGQEAEAVYKRHGSALRLLVPGIRLPGDAGGDQARVVTPRDASNAGATYIVVGRSVTTARDSRASMQAVLQSLGAEASR
jgi:orotidine-5'-phosphate decarboxylase